MHITYPYNEILPTKKAHDSYIINNCAALSNQEDVHVSLAIGSGSYSDSHLLQHYNIDYPSSLHIHCLPIVRKNNPMRFTWNWFFFYCTQRLIVKEHPNVVITSVLKQADYLFSRKVQKTSYVYEVHQLYWYPHLPLTKETEKLIAFERSILQKADLVTTTTQQLRDILTTPPYSLTNRIEVVPLAVDSQPLSSASAPQRPNHLNIAYVGQLYEEQGIELLLEAMVGCIGVTLHIFGGTSERIAALKEVASHLGLYNAVLFHGFIPPSELPHQLISIDTFVAPFRSVERMPYVAHTKIYEYLSWNRPIIAPDLPIIQEHGDHDAGILLYKPHNVRSLRHCIQKLLSPLYREVLQKNAKNASQPLSWEQRSKLYHAILEDMIHVSSAHDRPRQRLYSSCTENR